MARPKMSRKARRTTPTFVRFRDGERKAIQKIIQRVRKLEPSAPALTMSDVVRDCVVNALSGQTSWWMKLPLELTAEEFEKFGMFPSRRS